MPARTISRFGRSYTEYDPDGPGVGGPSTWILAAPGAGSGGGIGSNPSGLYTPAAGGAGQPVITGMPLYYSAPNTLDLAQAIDSPTPGASAHPYQVAGLAASGVIAGAQVSLITDGQITLADWTPLIGKADLDVGQRYYLSATGAGLLSAKPPTAGKSTVVSVGQAISQRTLEVEINVMVRL